MKSVIVVAMATFLFMSGNAMANSSASSGGAKASSAAGPWVECQLPDGKMDYTPLMICKLQKNGTVK
ncbi:hypothetical protein [Photobacterium lutimaris]|uniref:DUF3012 domain-containing protein n=1 Tax=Photobacterium lutimaris TaxID=388278 RepID=A0A2T3IUS5_9GAMM|nr:hypothetical protein [Photobacterium lutimaris]PSU32123.1 hypothetical protein C9I99_20145 [Photobacterium lutimaris]TDR73783.1 hypothetical protein DFP78_110154 [Photobacterium lutimaris]